MTPTDVPFSEQGSATLFAEVAVSVTSPEADALAQNFFPAVEMDWRNDCKPLDPTDDECYVWTFTEKNSIFRLHSSAASQPTSQPTSQIPGKIHLTGATPT